MPKHLYLPEVEGSIGEPPEAGVWHGYPRGLLRSLSDGIVVGQGAVDRGVSSVPDAWARPLMFQNALRPGSGHPVRARVVQEWRGLLSLLALHKLQQHSVDVVPVALADARVAEGAAQEFVRALTRLLPAPVALERGVPYSWGDTLLVRFDEIPVGAFSPTTLVYTAADYSRRLRETTLNLKDADGFLAPPDPGQREELRYVAEWVERLRDRLNAPENPGAAVLDSATAEPVARDAVRMINGLLDEWLGELRDVLRVGRKDAIDAKGVEVDPDVLEVRPAPAFLDRYRVYRELLRPLRRSDGGTAPRSDMLLAPGRNRSAHARVVLITPGLLGSGGAVWQSRRLAHLGGDVGRALEEHFREAAGDRVGPEDLRPHNAVWVRPEKYFLTDTLTATSDRSPLLTADWDALNGAQSHFLLPFTPQLLDFFAPEQVRALLRPEFRETESGVTFTFYLPVEGRAAERVQKTYRHRNPGPGEGAVESLDAPPVQIFPRYVDATWRRYYVLQGGADRVTVRPVVAAGCAVSERTHTSPDTRAVARAVEIAGDDAFPEALVFAPAAPTAREGATYGLALVPRPSEPPGLAGDWRVGIDFGTSNTNVYRQNRSSDVAERWTFDFSRYLWDVTAGHKAGQAAARDAELREFFVPPGAVELPIPTSLRVFEDARKSHLLLDYSIFFSGEYELPRNVHSDIKWDGDEEQKTKYFLESLLFLLLVEVGLQRVKRVELACSYPKAFSVERLARYKGEWEGVMTRLLDAPATAVMRRKQGADAGRPEVLDPVFQTEGVAAGEYFASDKTIANPADRAMKQIAAVCLDVGGGTTDISVWYENDIVFDASVLLAGRQISRLLQQNPRVLELLFSATATRALEQTRNEPSAFAARLNVVLKREEGAVREHLIDHANNREVQWIRRVLAVEFGAIAFYTASLLGAVDRALEGGLAREMETRGVTLHWGGNAAKLINWIDFGRYDEGGIASKMLNALLFNALKELGIKVPAAALGQKQSPGHKSEAAGGLVVMRLDRRPPAASGAAAGEYDMGDAAPNAASVLEASEFDMPDPDAPGGGADPMGARIVCGENIELTTGPVGHLDRISERTLFDGARTRFRRTSLDRLKRFVEIVNHFGVRFGLLTDDAKIALDARRQVQIADAVRARFVEAEAVREGQRVIEPVFVTEVKILLDFLRNELR